MTEFETNPKPSSIDLVAPDGVHIEQTSTRGDGTIERGERFARDNIDFSRVLEHLRIHTEGVVAGSQFNGEVFASPDDIISLVQTALPDDLHYDQHGRAEITLTTGGMEVGFSGVKPLNELESLDGIRFERGMRIPNGEPGEVHGIKGAWYPEMGRNPETGKFEVVMNPDGTVKNPHGKFEPEALIAHVETGELGSALSTDKITVILQKDRQDGRPTAITIFPGENAPAFPAKIQGDAFSVDTLTSRLEAIFWANHAFVQMS